MAVSLEISEKSPSDNDGDRGKVVKESYAGRLKSNVNFSQRLQRNVLEVTLERSDVNVDIVIDQVEIERVLKTLGIDIKSQVEGYQLQYKGAISVISVWMPIGVNLERFCKDMVIRVNDTVSTGMIRPAGKSEVTVTVIGLDFNTPDTLVLEYLGMFGKVKNNSVIYCEYSEGPFKGKKNGDRKYQVDFSGTRKNMGTFHLIDNCKVKVFYRGNMKTCARCHKPAISCVGSEIARNCEISGGDRIKLIDHMKSVWAEVGFAPTTFTLENGDNFEENEVQALYDAPVLKESSFPSVSIRNEPDSEDFDKCDGISVKNIPKNVEEKNIWEFLVDNGLPMEHGLENVRVNMGEKNSWVIIDGLELDEIKLIYNSIHFPITNKKYFDAPIYCKPLRRLTPTKANKVVDSELLKTPNDKTSKSIIPGLSKSQQKKAAKKPKERAKKEEEKVELSVDKGKSDRVPLSQNLKKRWAEHGICSD